jgi:hypothetical protein
MLRASLGKVVHTVKRAGTYAAKVPSQELHKIAVHVRAVIYTVWHQNKLFPVPKLQPHYQSSFFNHNKVFVCRCFLTDKPNFNTLALKYPYRFFCGGENHISSHLPCDILSIIFILWKIAS